MERFGFNRFGGPEVFDLIQADAPQPKANQVQLQVLAVGLNPYDASLRRGEQAASRPLKFPIVPGTDLVGRVTAIGADVTEFTLGDVVVNYRPIGAYSQVVTASANKVLKLPAGTDLTLAAALPQVSVVAQTILTQLALAPGATLGVVGASGGVGATLVQLATHAGLHVIAVASARNQAYLEQLGATHHYAYAEVPGGAAPTVVNASFGGRDAGASLKLLASGGRLLTTAAVPAPAGVQVEALGQPVAMRAALTAALAARVQLPITPLPFTVAGVRRGHQMLETHHAPGKFVLTHE